MSIKRISVKLMVCGLFLAFVSGCAGTIPKAKFAQEIAPESQIAAKDEAKVTVEAGPKVEIADHEKIRLASQIKQSIITRKALNTMPGDKKSYEVELLLTRYKKGNAFARMMLAGLGQIHIDGEVKLLELPDRKLVGEFFIKKTFAWGGAYGGSTSIEQIEKTFADGVAAALTGQKEKE